MARTVLLNHFESLHATAPARRAMTARAFWRIASAVFGLVAAALFAKLLLGLGPDPSPVRSLACALAALGSAYLGLLPPHRLTELAAVGTARVYGIAAAVLVAASLGGAPLVPAMAPYELALVVGTGALAFRAGFALV